MSKAPPSAPKGGIGQLRKGTFSRDENIVFVHTGGSAALFAYESAIW
jgi:L-cysteate sulfo-lyase